MELFGGVVPITGITFLVFSILAIIAAGFALGRITIKGVSLGDAGVFLVALVFGCIFYSDLAAQLTVDGVSYTREALKIVENLGLVLFVTSVGFTAGGSFGHYSVAAKLLLSFNMLVGRLELFPVLILFLPTAWSKK